MELKKKIWQNRQYRRYRCCRHHCRNHHHHITENAIWNELKTRKSVKMTWFVNVYCAPRTNLRHFNLNACVCNTHFFSYIWLSLIFITTESFDFGPFCNEHKEKSDEWQKKTLDIYDWVGRPHIWHRFHEGDSQLQSLIAEFTRHCYFWHIIIKCQTLSLQLNRIQSIDWKYPGRCSIGIYTYYTAIAQCRKQH